MERNNFRFVVISAVLITIILSLYFVLAAIGPTSLIFENNVTSTHDTGNFSLNWTAGSTGDQSYLLYIYTDGTLYNSSANTSATGYAFNNFTEANYTFTIEATNSTGTANSTNISMVVDRTAPTVELPQYTNLTAKKNTATLTLNISLIGSGLLGSGSTCIINVNGTNQSLTASGGWCNTTSGNLTNLDDVDRIIRVFGNDTVNALGINHSFFVTIDTTAPSLTLTKTSAGQTELIISVSGKDGSCTVDRSGATISGNTITETGLSCGSSYSYKVTCTDAAGNVGNSPATSFSTTGCSSGDSGGTSLPKKSSSSFSKITPGVVTIVKNFDAEIGVKQIQIEVNNEAQNVKITVTRYDSKPAAVSVEKSGKVYRYLQIEATNLADKLDKATVTIQVTKSWFSGNAVSVENVALFRFNDASDQWDELATTYIGSDEGDNELYEVELTSFSFFAIGEKSAVGEGAAEGEEDSGIVGAIKEGANLAWLWILIAVVVLVLIGLKMKKRK